MTYRRFQQTSYRALYAYHIVSISFLILNTFYVIVHYLITRNLLSHPSIKAWTMEEKISLEKTTPIQPMRNRPHGEPPHPQYCFTHQRELQQPQSN